MQFNSSNPYTGRILDKDDSFRLISLEQGRDDAPLIISLRSTTLDNAPPYEAVSYVWGDANALVPVQILDDKAQAFNVAIPSNCHAALKRLRKFDSPRTLWIDSICINQALLAEKAHQLTLMSFIYQRALQVVVYLGEGTHDTDVAMRCILELDQPSDYGTRNEVVKEPSPTTDEREAVRVLFDRPWFYRIWILQEITFAHSAIVVCGAHEVEWESFRKFYHWNVSNRWIDQLPYSLDYSVTPTLRAGYFLPYGERLMKMLIDTRLCGATDPRDKLYAILPLLDRDQEEMRSKVEHHKEMWKDEDEDPDHWNILEHSTKIQVNYDHTVTQVYTDLAMLLLQSNGLDVLRQVIKDPAVHRLPSWVPDWSTASSYWTAVNRPRERKNTFFAGFPERPTRYIWGWKSRYSHLIDTWTSSVYTSTENEALVQLHLRAVRVGTITKLGEVCDIAKNHFPIGQWASLVPQESYHKKRNIPEDLPYEETSRYRNGPMGLPLFIQALTMGDIVYSQAAEDAIAYIRQYNGEVLDNGEASRNVFGDASEETQQKVPLTEIFMGGGSFERQAQRILKGCDSKRFFVADNGDIGLAPDRARIGDVVFCVQGASVPFIFRSLPTTEICNNDKGEISSSSPHQVSADKLFCLLGEAYSLGIMEGEMWDDVENGKAKVVKIILR
ncbi:hypothetical protein ACHAPO_009809 [Fusarium lateritium]